MKISIVTAVYNNHNTLAAAIDSVLSQTHADLELIVIDGGSTDGTLDVLRSYGNLVAVLLSEPDYGIYDALNKGICLASGDVVGFLHSDDLFADVDVLKWVAKAFTDDKVEAVYGDLVYVRKDAPDRVVRYWRAGLFSQWKLALGWMPPHPTFYVRRTTYEHLGMFDINYQISADYDCILRFLGKGRVRVKYIPEVLVKMRVGGVSNRSLKNIFCKSREDYRAIKNNKVGGFMTLVYKNLSKITQFFRRQEK